MKSFRCHFDIRMDPFDGACCSSNRLKLILKDHLGQCPVCGTLWHKEDAISNNRNAGDTWCRQEVVSCEEPCRTKRDCRKCSLAKISKRPEWSSQDESSFMSKGEKS